MRKARVRPTKKIIGFKMTDGSMIGLSHAPGFNPSITWTESYRGIEAREYNVSTLIMWRNISEVYYRYTEETR